MANKSHAIFLKPFLKDRNFKIIGNMAVRKLPNNNIAKITLTDFGHADHYTQLLVKIVNVNDGLIEKQGFQFQEHMEIELNQSNPSAATCASNGLHVWNDMEWYINKPTKLSEKTYLDMIEEYVGLFE